MTRTSLYDEYAAISARSRARHGPRTVVLMEVGTFMEWYNAGGDERCADVRVVCEILNVQVTRKNKSIGPGT